MSPLPAFDPLGLPAPLWLVCGLKVFGFWVHMFFMNLWFAGLLVGLVLARRSGPAATTGARLLRAMPVFIAFGVNAGIVPLLFLQVVFPQFFYTSTVLQAWAWFAVVPLLLVAYYGTYVYVLSRKEGRATRWTDTAGWVAALVFVALGVVLSSEMQLLTRPDLWPEVAGPTTGGAVAGTALALDGTALLRWAMMFGLALATTAAWIAVDHHVLRGKEDRAGTLPSPPRRLVAGLALAGTAVFAAAALPYLRMAGPYLADSPWLQALAGVGPVLAVLGGLAYARRPGRASALALLGLQLLSLLFNAMARQAVQIGEVRRAFDPGSVPVHVQASPIALFLLTLLVGLGVLAWLLALFARAASSPAPA